MTLSDKRITGVIKFDIDNLYHYTEQDVREAIRELKEKLLEVLMPNEIQNTLVMNEIDEIFGEKLI